MSPMILGIVLILLAILLAFVVTRARVATSGLIRWPVSIVLSVLTVGIALIAVVDLRGVYVLTAPHGNPVTDLKVAATADQLARGEHMAHLCTGCHSTTNNFPLDGGGVNMVGSPDGSGLGTLYSQNLTPGGPLKDWSDGDIVRAIREGVVQDGHALVIMPSDGFRALSDADVQSIVAYLRSQPAVSHATPPREINLMGTLLVGAGLFPTAAQSPITAAVQPPPAGINAEHGAYLVTISGCRTCHGADLAGGKSGGGGPPPGQNLTVIVPNWTEAQFVQTIRTGKDPTGNALRPDIMPWKEYSEAYSDDELKAMYVVVHGLQPIQRAPG